jgi:hypothetical protein
MYRLGQTLETFLTTSNTNKRIIISTYNSYEWINTKHCRSMILLKFAYWLQGFKVYSKNNTNTAQFEWYDASKDQTTYHSPYNDF